MRLVRGREREREMGSNWFGKGEESVMSCLLYHVAVFTYHRMPCHGKRLVAVAGAARSFLNSP